jgi:hypothetical protein
MAVITRTALVDLDAWFANTGAGNGSGNGHGDRLFVGHGAPGGDLDWANRSAIRISRGSLFDGLTDLSQVVGMRIRLKARGDVIGIGSLPRVWFERGTTGFFETAVATRTGLTSGTGAGQWPGPTRTSTNRVLWAGVPADGTWISVPMAAMAKEWFTSGWGSLVLVMLAADLGTGYDEANSARRIGFASKDADVASNRPYIELDVNLNLAPNAPTDLTPTGDAVSPSANSTTLQMFARYSDPNGDQSTEDQFEVYPDSSTDAVLGTRTKLVYTIGPTAQGTIRSRTATGLAARTFYKWRARFRDAEVYGPWSLLQRAQTAYMPAAPTNVAVTPGTVTPDIFATIVSADLADYITAAEVNVYQDTATGAVITKWASGKQTVGGSSNRLQLGYSGSPLQFGQRYRLQVRLWNRDDVASPFSANFVFTPREPSGPIITPGDKSTKIDTLTPTFTLTDPGGQLIDQHRVRWYSPSGALLRDTGIVTSAASASKSIPTPSGLFDWGQEPMLDAAIRLDGNVDMGPFSERVTIHLNSVPGAPYPLAVLTAGAVRRVDDVWVVDSATPQLSIPFRDIDRDLGYLEAPTRREVEIVRSDGTPLAGSPFVSTVGITDAYVTPALTNETTYRIRARYDDTAGVRSDWSDFFTLKRSSAPTLSGVTPADAVTLTDPTPDIDWTFASAGGKAQARYRLVLSVAGSAIYDSGDQTDLATIFHVPPGVLPSGAVVSWTLTVWDTDGLSASITRSFTTSFTQPPALTGLTATPDADVDAIELAWTASALAAAEFEAYLVYAKGSEGPFELVATLTDQVTPAYTYRGAEHNTDVQIRVTQTNGWMESDPVEASASLDIDGFWWLRPDPLELRYVTPGGFTAAPDVRTEDFKPLRGGRFVLTWGDAGNEWTLRMELRPEARDVLASLQADYRAGLVGILKTPRAEAFYSKLTALPQTYAAAGFTEVTITGKEVGRAAGTF